jgi:hypothetical protein
VVNVAVEHQEPNVTRDVPDEYSTNAANAAQTAIVIDKDDTSSQCWHPPHSQMPNRLYSPVRIWRILVLYG